MAPAPITPPPLTLPALFPEPWASEWGEDEYGLWMAFAFRGVRQVLRWIPPGRFWMGSPEEEKQRSPDEVRHEVTLSEGFWLGDTVVTQALWETVLGENPSKFKGAQRPVERVSWEDCGRFLHGLNRERPDLGFRLPREAEWEYACRAGTETPFWFGESISPELANYDATYPYVEKNKGPFRQETIDVKALQCNSWGLYQMHGNVSEWCEDWDGEYPQGPVTDPRGPETGSERVLRGGSWVDYGWICRSAKRIHWKSSGRAISVIGFRLARGRTVKSGK